MRKDKRVSIDPKQPDDDLLLGVPDIHKEVRKLFGGRRLSQRQVRYQLENGWLPGGRLGNQWISSKTRLRETLAELASGGNNGAP